MCHRAVQVFPLVGVVLLASSCCAKAEILAGPFVRPATGHVYFLLKQANWTESEQQAVELGGHLVTINDADENHWVTSTFGHFGGIPRALWIGLSDAEQEGTFVWSSGEPASYRKWAQLEPNNHVGREDSVHIMPEDDRAHRYPGWNDAPDNEASFGYTFNGVVELAPVSDFEPRADGRLRRRGEMKIQEVTKQDLLERVPNFFHFHYQHPPQPGLRVWVRLDDDTFEERYSEAGNQKFQIVGRDRVEGVIGTIVLRESDKEMQVFVPDKTERRKQVWFRLTNDEGPWTLLGQATTDPAGTPGKADAPR